MSVKFNLLLDSNIDIDLVNMDIFCVASQEEISSFSNQSINNITNTISGISGSFSYGFFVQYQESSCVAICTVGSVVQVDVFGGNFLAYTNTATFNFDVTSNIVYTDSQAYAQLSTNNLNYVLNNEPTFVAIKSPTRYVGLQLPKLAVDSNESGNVEVKYLTTMKSNVPVFAYGSLNGQDGVVEIFADNINNNLIYSSKIPAVRYIETKQINNITEIEQAVYHSAPIYGGQIHYIMDNGNLFGFKTKNVNGGKILIRLQPVIKSINNTSFYIKYIQDKDIETAGAFTQSSIYSSDSGVVNTSSQVYTFYEGYTASTTFDASDLNPSDSVIIHIVEISDLSSALIQQGDYKQQTGGV